MTDIEIKEKIAEIIREECLNKGFYVIKLILFGSRAIGSSNSESDWDFIAILDKQISWKDKMKIWLPINKRLGRLGIDADVLLKSESDFERERSDTGKVSYYASRYGIVA
jgi:predicted nucleotidyltransferase